MDDMQVKGVSANALETFAFLQRNKVDLLFLDIQMPKMSGIDLIRSLQDKPRIILTTAYREYAVEGFELDVLDDLVKPISFERFLKSVARYNQFTLMKVVAEPAAANTFQTAYMYFKVNKELVKIFLKDIIYIESIKDYVKIVTEQKQFVTYQRLSYMEEKLPENKFLRVHKSYIISFDKIKSYTNDSVTAGTVSLPIGRLFKQNALSRINSHV